MKIAVVDQGLQIESDNRCSFDERVLNESCIFAIAHPNALLDQHVSELICPDRDFSIELKFKYREMALRRNRSARPSVGCEWVCFSIDAGQFVETAHEKCSPSGRVQCLDQQAVIAPGRVALNTAVGKSPDAVRE